MANPPKSSLLKQAQAAETAGQFKMAEQLLLRMIKTTPKDVTAYTQLTRLYTRKAHDTAKALQILPKMLKLAPKSALAHELAAECFCKKHMLSSAKIHADATVKYGPKSPDGLYVAATVYYDLEDYDLATKCMEKCLSVRPEHLQSRLLYAKSLRAAGALKKAEQICREIFAQYPGSAPNYSIWSQTCKIKADDPIYLHIRDVIYPKLKANTPARLPPILKILGKAENDIGNYDTAFQHFTDSKSKPAEKHDRAVNKLFVNKIVSHVSRADYFGVAGNNSESPVLVVGMPRTGSTLLEQILSSHPQIGGIGESKNLREIAHHAGLKGHDGTSLIRLIHDMPAEKTMACADEYLKRSVAAEPNMLRIVDKNLHNFELLGLFAKMFPKARIINALRDPMDNCVSCYLAPLSHFHSYTQDLTSLGQYYSEFRRLMAHWKNVLPNPIMEVHYEDVVADTEGKARDIIDFLGLEWDPACLSFQENKNVARTISTWQVRQPIYQTSVKRWARYDKHLDPLKTELAHFYPNGFE